LFVFKTYRAILSLPGSKRFSFAGFIARSPMAMYGLATVLLVQSRFDSYFLAGVVGATLSLAAAIGAPISSRFADRYGQHRVLPLILTIHAISLSALIGFVLLDFEFYLIVIAAAFSGLAMPSVGPMVRARWMYVTKSDRQLNTAFAFESVVDEVIFVLAPPIVTILCVSVFDALGLLLSVLLVTSGSIWLTTQRATEPPPLPKGQKRSKPAILMPGMVSVFLIFMLFGGVWGAAEIVVVAFSQELGNKNLAGALIAVWSFGSLVAGVIFGTANFSGSISIRFTVTMFFFAMSLLILPFISSFEVMFPVLLIAGLAISPALITGYTLVGKLVNRDQLTEGLAWANTGSGLGLSLSAPFAGWIIDERNASAAFWLVALSGLVGFLLTVISLPWLRRADYPDRNLNQLS
jgi:predicted MFS family arabinose efflux permease